jgi:N-methylhydantoinase A/oxoprolinase/acetone carboxylase beta subunit
VVTVSRGVDPRGLALVAFGGAGPLHACAVAEALDMLAVVVPPRAGVLSAVGLLVSPRQRELVRTWSAPDDHDVAEASAVLVTAARSLVGADADGVAFVDCRYAGQSHALTVPSVDAFHAEHERRNGFARRDEAIEVVALRARAVRPAPLELTSLPEPTRSVVRGPAAAAEPDCTVWVPDGWTARSGPLGAWILRRDGDAP